MDHRPKKILLNAQAPGAYPYRARHQRTSFQSRCRHSGPNRLPKSNLGCIEYRDLHCAKPVRIAHNFDRGDFTARKREAQHSEEAALRRHNQPDSAIHHCRVRKPRAARGSNCLSSPVPGAAHLALNATDRCSGVRLYHEARIKHREERFHIAASQCCKKSTHHLPLAGRLGIGRYGRSTNASTRTAGELSRRLRRPIQYGRDFVKREIEEIM